MTPAVWYEELGEKPSYDRRDLETLLHKRRFVPAVHRTPTRFISDDAFMLFPHERGRALPRLATHLAAHGIKRTIVCLPHFLELDPLVFWTHRDADIPHAAVSATQSLAISTMVRELAPQCVIATHESARAFSTALSVSGIDGDFHWYLIAQMGMPADAPDDRPLHIDAHIIPGVSGGYQCAALAQARDARIHLAPEFEWDVADGAALATSRASAILPLWRYTAAPARPDGTCECGETMYVC